MKNICILISGIAIVAGLAACEKEKAPTDLSGGCEAVDLGLSVKWASFNVGAAKPEDAGYYFAWGETTKKITMIV